MLENQDAVSNEFNGFGAADFNTGNEVQVNELLKAMSAGNGGSGGSTANAGAQSGSIQPAITESLESKLKYLTLQRKELKFWRMVKTSPAFALSEEFLQLVDIGSDRGGFHNEFDLPEQEDTTYARMSEQVKYLGNTRAISHQAQLVRTGGGLGDVVNREVENGTTWILRKLNRALAYGDASVIPAEFNGLYAQHGAHGVGRAYSSLQAYHDSEVVIDMRGKALTQEQFFDGAEIIDENHGYADTLFAPNSVVTDLAKDYLDKQRVYLNSGTVNNIGGAMPTSIMTPHGNINLEIDKFLKGAKPRKTTESAQTPKAPTAPVADATTPKAVAADATSKFYDGAGDYYYAVAAVNRFGESALTPLGTAKLAVASGQSVDLKFTAAGSTYPATGFVIYRSKVNPAGAIGEVDLYPVFSVSTSGVSAGHDGAAAGLVRDKNRFISGTEQAFMWQSGDEVFEFKQLAPLMRMDLARVDPTLRFMILMYGTPQLYSPKKVVRYINIGKFVAV